MARSYYFLLIADIPEKMKLMPLFITMALVMLTFMSSGYAFPGGIRGWNPGKKGSISGFGPRRRAKEKMKQKVVDKFVKPHIDAGIKAGQVSLAKKGIGRR